MYQEPQILILRPFNGVFFALCALFLLLLIVGSVILRKKSDKTRRVALALTCLLTLVGFFFYKYSLSIDANYDLLTAGTGGFNWWNELPLHLCNINMILIPIAVLLNKKPLMSFCFFVAPLGAAMALCMPGAGFDQYSILLPRMLGYYGTHFMIVIEGLAIATLGLYRPHFRDMPRTILAIFAISLAVFGINMLMRWTGIYPRANYFYSVETDGNFILDLFYRVLPYPYLYLIPCVGILVVYMSLITLLFTAAERMRTKQPA